MDLLAELNTRGITVPDDRLAPAQVADIHEYLQPQLLWLGSHVADLARATDLTTAAFMANPDYSHGLGCYAFDVAERCPHLTEKALQYAGLAQEYFGAETKLFHRNIFWSFPGGPVSPKIQEWHRDLYTFDDKQFVIYFYLTDVDSDGAHGYVLSNGLGSICSAHQTLVDSCPRCHPSRVYITGKAGTLFVEDPSGLHKGQKPTSRCRLMAWARYGVLVPERDEWKSGLKT